MLGAGACAGCLWLVSGPIARRVFLHQLAKAGWPNATIGHVGLGWGTATVDQFDLTGAKQLVIERITADWSLADVHLSGVALRLPEADLSPLRPINGPPASATPTWPVGRLDVTDVTVVIGEHAGSGDMQVVRLGPDRVQVRASLRDAQAASVQVDGTLTLAGDADLRAQFQALPLSMLKPNARGLATGEVRLTRSSGVLAVEGPLTIKGPAYSLPLVGDIHAQQLAGHIRWDGELTGRATLTKAEARVFGQPVTVPTAELQRDGQRLEIRARMQALGADFSIDGHATNDWGTAAGTVRASGLDLGAATRLIQPWYALPLTVSGLAGFEATISKLANAWRGRATVTVTDALIEKVEKNEKVEKEESPLQSGVTRLTIPQAGAELTGSVIDGGFSGTAVLRVTHTQISAPGISVTSIDGTLPWSIGTDPQLDGSLQFTGVTVYGFPVRQLAAHVRGVDQRIGGAANFAVLDEGRGRIDGWYDLTRRGGTFGLVVPRFTLTDPGAVRRFSPALGQRDLTGEIDLSGTVDIADQRITPVLRVSLSEAVFADPEAKLTVNGLAASTTITGFTPFATSGTKQVAFRSATIGSLAFGDGTARVAARLPDGLDITEATIAWCGGRLVIPQLAVDLPNRRASGTIALKRIELGALLQATIPQQMSGQGLISGDVPLTLTWPDFVFTFGRGSLQADPPTGSLHLKDRTPLSRSIATGFAQVDAKIVDTIADLLFDDLRIDLVPETPLQTVAKVHVQGHGRSGDPPLAVGGLDVNLRGIERALADALFLQRWQSAAGSRPAADSSIDHFFAP